MKILKYIGAFTVVMLCAYTLYAASPTQYNTANNLMTEAKKPGTTADRLKAIKTQLQRMDAKAFKTQIDQVDTLIAAASTRKPADRPESSSSSNVQLSEADAAEIAAKIMMTLNENQKYVTFLNSNTSFGEELGAKVKDLGAQSNDRDAIYADAMQWAQDWINDELGWSEEPASLTDEETKRVERLTQEIMGELTSEFTGAAQQDVIQSAKFGDTLNQEVAKRLKKKDDQIKKEVKEMAAQQLNVEPMDDAAAAMLADEILAEINTNYSGNKAALAIIKVINRGAVIQTIKIKSKTMQDRDELKKYGVNEFTKYVNNNLSASPDSSTGTPPSTQGSSSTAAPTGEEDSSSAAAKPLTGKDRADFANPILDAIEKEFSGKSSAEIVDEMKKIENLSTLPEKTKERSIAELRFIAMAACALDRKDADKNAIVKLVKQELPNITRNQSDAKGNITKVKITTEETDALSADLMWDYANQTDIY